MLFKILKFQKPQYLAEQYQFRKEVHNVPTRNAASLLQIPQHATILYSKSFHLQSINLYNTSVLLFNLSKSVNSFKNEYKKLLIETYVN